MSGAQDLLLGNFSTAAAGYQIERSLRFNSADSAYLNRTPASAGNQKTWTWSAWVKRSKLGSSYFEALFAVSGAPRQYLAFYQDKFYMYGTGSTGDFVELSSNAVYRDTSAWYHLVVTYDTTQATGSNRVKVYINGVEQALTFTTTPTQNSDGAINRAGDHFLGAETVSANRFNGYMTEINFIDGQALTPSSFGQTNSATGVWEPKAYSGSYGTNGFYLKFADNSGTTSTTLGKDSSGNGNNWTPNNFSVTAGAGNDSLVDTPTPYGTDTGAGGEVRGNYCTLNPLDKSSNGTAYSLSNGNLDATAAGAQWENIRGTHGMSSGKWYWEITITSSINDVMVGIATIGSSITTRLYQQAGGYFFRCTDDVNDVAKWNNNTSASYGSTLDLNDVCGVAFNADTGDLTFYKNGSSLGSAYTVTTGATYLPALNGNGDRGSVIANFGQRPFAYTAPSGYKALCTTNLPTPTIGATATTRADDYFNTVLRNGFGPSGGTVTVGFQPDFVWQKRRDGVSNNWLNDSIRGGTKNLVSNDTAAETTDANWITAFTSTGFTMGSSDWGTNETVVSWAWKANGAGSSNTQGTITSTVSANTTAGFSIVTWNSGSAGNKTVGHGLGVQPSMLIMKVRDAAGGWYVWFTGFSGSQFLGLNDTGGTGTDSRLWANAAPTSTVFSFESGYYPAINKDMVAYAFNSVAGYSTFGSYTGNGSSDGPFIYTGFRPAFVMVKRTDSTGNWLIQNNKTLGYNPSNSELYANLTNAETTADRADFLSNGFKPRINSIENNASGGTYIYMALAENPFKYSLAR